MSFCDFFLEPYRDYTQGQIMMEAIAVFFALLSVFFSIRRDIRVYPTGLVSTVLYVYILYKIGLLGDMLINVYYTVMSIYGWILWSKNKEVKGSVKIEYASGKDWLMSTILLLFSFIFVCLVYYNKPYIDNRFSSEGVKLGLYHLDWANWLDIFTTSLFLVGMWLMAKRKIENWIFWVIGDCICIWMMLYKGLGLTSFQFLVFTILAIMGYCQWKKQIKIGNNLKSI